MEKIFPKNKPMRVWLWLACKFTKNYYYLRLFEFILTQNSYPSSIDKTGILT